MKKHLGEYAEGSSFLDHYRVCLACGRVRRNPYTKPLLHNGRKWRG